METEEGTKEAPKCITSQKYRWPLASEIGTVLWGWAFSLGGCVLMPGVSKVFWIELFRIELNCWTPNWCQRIAELVWEKNTCLILDVVSLPLELPHEGLFTQCYRQPITLTPGCSKRKKKRCISLVPIKGQCAAKCSKTQNPRCLLTVGFKG